MPDIQRFALRQSGASRSIELLTKRNSTLFTIHPSGQVSTGGGLAIGRTFTGDELRLVAELAERFQDTWDRFGQHQLTAQGYPIQVTPPLTAYALPENLRLLPYQLELVALPAGERTYPEVVKAAQSDHWPGALKTLERELGQQVEKTPQAQATHKLAYSWWENGKWHEQRYATLPGRDYLPQYVRLTAPDADE